MNPQEQEHVPSFELPPARPAEQNTVAMPERQGADRNEKQANVAVEHGAARQQAPPMPPQLTQQPVGQASVPDPYAQPAGQVTGPPVAEDADLIEKEWVTKAKEIVARTSHDPHLQNKEMNKFKADYLKKRYNKEVKISEDQ